MLGATKRMPEDELDHLTLYKLLPNEDGTTSLFKVSDQVISTTVAPARGSIEEITASKSTTTSLSLSYGSLIVTEGATSKQVVLCQDTEYFADNQCQPCDSGSGASFVMATSCVPCEQLWF